MERTFLELMTAIDADDSEPSTMATVYDVPELDAARAVTTLGEHSEKLRELLEKIAETTGGV
tara:strand:- start:342 stop:527 length:186 start_codon:yes stop_codon:yes gene_type:complete